MFKRKLTSHIEELKSSNEGVENPKTVQALERIDAELAALQKEIKKLLKESK